MFLLRKPSSETVRKFILSQLDLPFTYSAVGATRSETAPAGFTVDHNRRQLGFGENTFKLGVSALRDWKQFELGWVTIVPPLTPLEVGKVVAVRAHTFGFWSLSAARIVYLIEESARVKRFGFAYGTLTNHVECGEERFMIEWLEDDSVWYDIYAFSHPQHPLVRLGSPLARLLQKRFIRNSLDAISSATLCH
ncbi:MAG TPA: DUF1990 domain-containing protein [Pyrinomonadaceae bacterium]|jgi:uncharacterized protein (UPF0548 family)|nr:DUF1990 domain-containing protein [Pyrinomonadaceae bacterium]